MQNQARFPLTKESIIANSPLEKGCYLVFDSFGKCLYVGRSIRIRQRMLAHFIGGGWRLSGSVEPWLSHPIAPLGCTFCIQECESLVELERRLIKEMLPSHNAVRYNGENLPKFSVMVDVGESPRKAFVVGESKNKKKWRLFFDGNSPSSIENYPKTWCSTPIKQGSI